VRTAGERREHLLGIVGAAGLAEQLAVEQHLGVDAEHRPVSRRD